MRATMPPVNAVRRLPFNDLCAWMLGVLLPPQCAACGTSIAAAASLCAPCWTTLHLIEAPYCERLGIPLAFDPSTGDWHSGSGGGNVSPAAIRSPPLYARARAACLFGDTARALVHGLKYRDRHDMAGLMARLMVRAGAQLLADADVVCPVPLHRGRLWLRRFNQSALLGKGVAGAAAKPFAADLLTRLRATRQQVGLSLDQRQRNVAGAFAIDARHGAEIAGRRVLLIDDVYTTGATVEACTRALLKAGARDVDVLTFARVAETVENPI